MGTDQRILSILQAVSYGEEDTSEDGCIHCLSKDENIPAMHIAHKPSCPVTLARTILKEMQTPLIEYRIEYEARAINAHTWRSYTATQLAFSKQEALREWSDTPDPDDLSRGKIRNAKATIIREIL